MSKDTQKAHDFLHTLNGAPTPEGSQQRLQAHEVVLRYGAPGYGETARDIAMCEALADICKVLATVSLMPYSQRARNYAWDE